MRYIQLWDARRDSIVHADWSDGVLPFPDPYMLWYRRHTRLLVGNPRHLSESGYQGVGPSLEALWFELGGHITWLRMPFSDVVDRMRCRPLQRFESYCARGSSMPIG